MLSFNGKNAKAKKSITEFKVGLILLVQKCFYLLQNKIWEICLTTCHSVSTKWVKTSKIDINTYLIVKTNILNIQ